MGKTFAYMRISTAEERGLQKYDRQEQAIARWRKENNTEIPERRIYRDDASGKSFDRPAWKELVGDLAEGDTVVFKDLCRFTRQYEEGFTVYMDLMQRGIDLVFIDNMTVSTEYINRMMQLASQQSNRIAQKTLQNTVELLLLVELDRAEREREITAQRIRDGIAASPKKSGRPVGKLDKMTTELEADLKRYAAQTVTERTTTQADLMKKHGISRNTLKKYLAIVQGGV